jgi:carboxynorspermidine decarboxylase
VAELYGGRKSRMQDLAFDPRALETPYYIVDIGRLRQNLAILADVQRRSGCKILLALKGFAMWSVFPVVREYLVGTTASSVYEARLGREEMGGEVHAYAPAYSDQDMRELVEIADHIVFNSLNQWRRHRDTVAAAPRKIECALRVNPEHSETEYPLYDPCAPGSRLGVRRAQLEGEDLSGLSGLHFHTLCQKGADALQRTVAAVERKFGDLIPQFQWVNFGGGHHISRPDYDVDLLVRVVTDFQNKWQRPVYLEPGEAIALDTGWLVSEVQDIIDGPQPIAILDTSATAHMPDVLEAPYRPEIVEAGTPGEKSHTYRLGGLTCLAGDVIGDYSFDRPLQVGDRLVFEDMAHYTMVKNTMFNGVRLPSIVTVDPASGETRVVRKFGYEDYKSRLS